MAMDPARLHADGISDRVLEALKHIEALYMTHRLRKYLLLLATLVVTVTYAAGFNPPGGVWQDTRDGQLVGDPIIRATHYHWFLAFYYCNATVFAASLVVIVLIQRCKRAVSLQAMERTWQCYSNKPIKSFLDAIPCDVKISVTTSPEGGIDIKIGSHTKHVPKYLSVHHLLVQMVLFAHKSSEGISSYIKSIMPKSIFDMAKRLCSFALPNVSQHHSDPVSCKAERGITKAVGAKTSDPWIVATGSPHHATGNHALLSGSITEHDGLFVHAVNRAPMQVRGCGALVTAEVVLPDVWVVPGLTANLVSVRQLNELGYIVGFGGGACYISSAADGTIIGKATLGEGGLYVLDFLKVPLGM